MKKRILLVCLLALCALVFTGCGSDPAVSENAAISSQAADTAPEDTFSSEDMSNFVFEGTEYTFPMSYDVLVEQGWEITDYSYELLSEEDLETGFLELESEQYPGVVMDIYILNTMHPDYARGSVEELEQEFKENGVWGIDIRLEEEGSNVSSYPGLSFKGVTFGSSPDDIISAFGTGYDSLLYEYEYFTIEGGLCYSLCFEVENDVVCSIYSLYASAD